MENGRRNSVLLLAPLKGGRRQGNTLTWQGILCVLVSSVDLKIKSLSSSSSVPLISESLVKAQAVAVTCPLASRNPHGGEHASADAFLHLSQIWVVLVLNYKEKKKERRWKNSYNFWFFFL